MKRWMNIAAIGGAVIVTLVGCLPEQPREFDPEIPGGEWVDPGDPGGADEVAADVGGDEDSPGPAPGGATPAVAPGGAADESPAAGADTGGEAPAQDAPGAPPTDPSSAELKSIAPRLFAASHTVTTQVSETVYLAASAAYRASILNGGAETYTGTLTYLDANNAQNATYAPTPQDRLVVIVEGGAPTEYVFQQLSAWQSGPQSYYPYWEHAADFTVSSASGVNVRIVSEAAPVASGKSQWRRQISGVIVDGVEPLAVELTHNGDWDNSGSDAYAGFLFERRAESAGGTIRGGDAVITVSDEYEFNYAFHNTPFVRHLFQYWMRTNSSVRVSESTFAYENALVRWEKQSASGGGEALYNVVGEPGYWACSGALLRDGQVLGNLEFTGPVEDGSYGPDLVLKLATGESVLVHPLIVP